MFFFFRESEQQAHTDIKKEDEVCGALVPVRLLSHLIIWGPGLPVPDSFGLLLELVVREAGRKELRHFQTRTVTDHSIC